MSRSSRERIKDVMDALWKRADINDEPVEIRGQAFGVWANDLGIALQELPDHLAMIREFHEAVGAPVYDVPALPFKERTDLRMKLLMEEHGELMYELGCASWHADPDLAKIAKELADLLVVTYGCALEFGIDLNAVFAEVHRSNMSKTQECPKCHGEGSVWDGPLLCAHCNGTGRTVFKRDDGKVLKGPNYTPPDVEGVLWPHPQKT